MGDEGFFNNHLFSSMEDDNKNKKYLLSSMEKDKKRNCRATP